MAGVDVERDMVLAEEEDEEAPLVAEVRRCSAGRGFAGLEVSAVEESKDWR